MKRSNLYGACAALAGNRAFTAYRAEAQERKPPDIRNILVLFVDQQCQDCIGCYGNPVVQTPSIDRLAQTGIR